MLGEELQAPGEDVGRDAVELVLELVEALGALEERGDEQKRPAVADAGERVRERGGRRGAAASAGHLSDASDRLLR
jgi:hypothetical protein